MQEEVQEIDVSQEGKEENLKQVLESIFLSLKDKLNKEKECLGTMYEVQSYLKKKKEELWANFQQDFCNCDHSLLETKNTILSGEYLRKWPVVTQ